LGKKAIQAEKKRRGNQRREYQARRGEREGEVGFENREAMGRWSSERGVACVVC
jgi:hypothetical protein